MKHSLLLISVVLLCGCSSSKDIRIGYIGPLTGDAVSYGVDTLHGVELAMKNINDRGGIEGKHVRLIVEDGRCTPQEAANAAHKLINIDHVAAIIGGNCSTETLAAAPVAEAAKVLLLSPISSSAKVSDAGDFVFRTYPSGAFTGKMYAQFFSSKNMRKIAMLSEDTDYCRGLQSAIKNSLPAESSLVFDEVVEPGTKDFRSLLTRLKALDFDILALQMQSDAAVGAVMQQFKEFGINAPVVGNDVAESNTLRPMQDAMEGMYLIAIASPDTSRSEAMGFENAFTQTYGEPKQNFFYPALAYDAANILLRGLERTMDGTGLRDYLYALPSHAGVMGDISFDEKGDVRGISYGFKQWSNGQVMQLEVLPIE